MDVSLSKLHATIASCDICRQHLPLGPRPVVQFSSESGDAPPRPECAPQWHERVLDAIAPNPLLLLTGQYAQRHYLGAARKKSLTETVRSFDEYGTQTMPLPHPSWRSRIWMKNNPWFEAKLIPVLRRRVKNRLEDSVGRVGAKPHQAP